jgi:hypothetical protein
MWARDFEVFEVNTIVDDSKGSPDIKMTPGAKTSLLCDLSDFEVLR